MAVPLLKTKLYRPPVRPGLVERPRLIDRLDEKWRFGCKLTLISAPAGFGKSTLVAEWLAKDNRSAAWLSLDEGDNDPVRFWTYLIAAIQSIYPDVGVEMRQVVNSPQLLSAEWVIVSLLNEIAELKSELVLVLDDYHAIQSEKIHRDMDYLLEYQPANLRLVLITRVDPPMSLARLRAHGQLAEIRAMDLQFSVEEVTVLLDEAMPIKLTPEQVAALHRRTEGWIVSLQLAALSLSRLHAFDTFFTHFTGSHQFILDYLTEEVLRVLPDKQRRFLLQTSILDRFCAPLCQVITGNAASQRVLEDLHKANLFIIPLESNGQWFRYHHLFAEVLQALLRRDDPDGLSQLHLKAAAWFENAGYPGEAVDHALRSGNQVYAGEMVLKHWTPFLHRGEIATVLRWLDALPQEIEANTPSLSLARCWALFISGRNTAVAPHLENANSAYSRLVRQGVLSDTQQNLIAVQLAMMYSVLARSRGDHRQSVAYAEEAVRLLPAETDEGVGASWVMLAAARAGSGDFNGAIQAYEQGISLSHAEGNLIAAYGCIYGQAMYLLVQGRLNDAEALCLSYINLTRREGHADLPATGSIHIATARIMMERYDFEQAERYVNDGLRIALPGGFGEAQRSGRYLRARLAAARGELDAAADILHDTARIVTAMNDPYLTGELNWQWALLYIKTGDLDVARRKLDAMEEMIAVTQHANLLLWFRGLYPRLLYAEERFDEALIALDESITWTRSADSKGELVHLLALQALAQKALGDHGRARSSLLEALALGAPGNYIMRWLDAGPGIAPLLHDLNRARTTSQAVQPYLESLLGACQSAFGELAQPQSRTLLESLTPREIEIMRLISRGYSNPEIASELVVTVNTIKKHTSNIYGKLGVRSRTQAIARAHELDLV